MLYLPLTIHYKIENPQGLDEILFKLLVHHIPGDWDKDIPSTLYIGKIKKENVSRSLPGRKGFFWGQTLEKYAAEYLKNHLEKNGWTVLLNYKEKGFEYDLLGWEMKQSSTPDLHVEFHFPQIKKFPYRLDLDKKMTADKKKLDRKNAKHGYIVVGIPHNTEIQLEQTESLQSTIKLQEYRFRYTAIEKRTSRAQL